ncbi:MAG: hypothetical protein CVT48_06635, partial [Thermoplasmata archaeon HGW-Thermoplasmata-1]
GFPENKEAAHKGGTIAGGARVKLEKESGRSVASPDNYLEAPESVKRIEKRKRKESLPATPDGDAKGEGSIEDPEK